MGRSTFFAGRRLFRWTRPGRWLKSKGQLVYIVKGVNTFSLWFRPNRGFLCTEVSRRLRGGDVSTRSFDLEFLSVKKVKISAAVSMGGPTHLAAVETNVFKQFPAIIAHCAVTRYDDGTAREPGKVFLATDGAAWRLTAKDPDGMAQMTAVGQTFDDALALLDMLLGAEDAPWEPDRWALKNNAGRSRK